jgi:hypothetical protein
MSCQNNPQKDDVDAASGSGSGGGILLLEQTAGSGQVGGSMWHHLHVLCVVYYIN